MIRTNKNVIEKNMRVNDEEMDGNREAKDT